MVETCTRKEKTFKILSIDGGGIKGLYSSTILNVFEKHYNANVSDCFDLICGTSTGGLIALALSTGMSAENISRIYRDKAKIIFPPIQNTVKTPIINNVLSFFKQSFHCNKYDNNGLQEVLNDIFQNKKMRDAKTNLCIPATNLTCCEPLVFKTGHCTDYTRDPEIPMKEVALATSAAPTYFPIAKIDSIPHDLVDGGLWANDPCLVGLTEAIKCFIGKDKGYTAIDILSIASVSTNSGKVIQKNGDNSYLSWNGGISLIDTIMKIQSKAAQNYIKILCDNLPFKINYIRIPEPNLSAEQAKKLELDSTEENKLKTLESLGNNMAYKWVKEKNLASLFSSKHKEIITVKGIES